MSKGFLLGNFWEYKLSNYCGIALGIVVAFDSIIKGRHPFPKNMLITATVGTWTS